MVEKGLSEHDWRVIWEEVLDDDARRRIKRAIWRGEALSSPDEAAVAIERAQQARRGLGWRVLLNMAGGLVLIAVGFYLVDLPATAYFWVLMATYALVVAASPLAGWLRQRQLDRAIEANRHHWPPV